MLMFPRVFYKNDSGLTGGDGRPREDSHPSVSDINEYGQDLLTDERIAWLQEHLGIDRETANEMQDMVQRYSDDLYDVIHRGEHQRGNEVLDAMIENPRSPVYSGSQWRGIYVTDDGLSEMGLNVSTREYLEGILRSGVWKENGVTSFSANREVAEDFGHINSTRWDDSAVAVLIHYSGGRSGMPIKHLSVVAREDEVLHSGRQMKEGMPILRHQWEETDKGTNLHIYLTDKKRRG